MNALAILALAVAAASGSGDGEARGAQLATAQVRAEIVRPAIVRQASGWQESTDAPRPQITRGARTILVEFQ